jgi:phosphoribosylglycinamide formyltransferase-1
MLSGGGRTLDNLLAATKDGRLHARICLVIASTECKGAEKARAAGIKTIIAPGTIASHDLETMLAEASAQWVALAGYLKLVRVPQRFRGRIINIHPGLLPAFGGKGMHGMHVHEAVIASKQNSSGCTVHLVDDQYDTGPILMQMRCPVLASDTPASLAARVFECECATYPRALQELLHGTCVVPQLMPAGAT